MINFLNSIACLFISLGILCASCGDQNNPNSNSAEINPMATDTILKINIDTIVNRINQAIYEQGLLENIPFPVYNSFDTIRYWPVDVNSARVSVALTYPDKIVWPTYFLEDGKIIFVRYRFWSMPEPAYASEHMLYIQDNKISYCEERRMDLQPDERPALLREKAFAICSVPPAEIEKDYKQYWKTIEEYLPNNQLVK